MARIPEQVRKALYGKLNVAGVTTYVTTRIYADQAPETATYPFIVIARGVTGNLAYTLGNTVTLEDDLWTIAAYTTEDDLTTASPAELGMTIIGACSTAIGTALTLSAGTAAYCAPFAYMPPLVTNVGDRVVWKHGLIVRVGAY